jgi:drug/metabolite transporter (DMT)-like permease
MNIIALYLVAVLIWGSTWLVITFQYGTVSPAVSVVYRFFLASLFLLSWCLIRKLPMRFTLRQHAWIALQGMMLFGVNYVLVYLAETTLTSGLVATVFSLVVFLNIVGARVFLGTPIRRSTLIGALLGITGIVFVFLPEFSSKNASSALTTGLILAILGAVSASCGNILVSRNVRSGLPIIQMNTFGMFYGALAVAVYVTLTHQMFVFDSSPRYLLSLTYLALFGSVIAFGAYIALIGKVGPGRAGYANVAIPVVALLLSGVFEGLKWSPFLLGGIVLCGAGNVVILKGR